MIPHAIERWSTTEGMEIAGLRLNPVTAVLMHMAFGYVTVLFFDKVLFSTVNLEGIMDPCDKCDYDHSHEHKYVSTQPSIVGQRDWQQLEPKTEKCLNSRTAILLLLAMSVHRYVLITSFGIHLLNLCHLPLYLNTAFLKRWPWGSVMICRQLW
jgi:hypothetical protein